MLHPFTAIVSGPTGCGKTEYVTKLVEKAQTVIFPPPTGIRWYYSQWQPGYEDRRLRELEFSEGIPGEWGVDPKERTLIVLDDLLMETNRKVTELFVRGSHHWNVSCVYITQNLFSRNKENRTLNLNAQYMTVFKNAREMSQVTHLAKQAFPGQVKYVQEAFADSTKRPYGYLFFDLKATTPDDLRLRTNIFEEEGGLQYVYLPK